MERQRGGGDRREKRNEEGYKKDTDRQNHLLEYDGQLDSEGYNSFIHYSFKATTK